MKNPIMLACAMIATMGLSVLAEDQATTATTSGSTPQAQTCTKGSHPKLTEAQREAMINKRLETIKAKDEALYKELVALREKDPAAFKAKMRELSKADAKAHGGTQCQGQAKSATAKAK